MHTFFSLQLAARISAILLALAISVPVLLPQHYLPTATFRQEWLTLFLGLLALLPVALHREGEWIIPRSAMLPIALAALVWVQYLSGIDVRFETTLIASLYFVWAFLIVLLTRRVAHILGRDAFASIIAMALWVGAMFLALSGALQHWAPSIGLPWIFPASNAAISGNLAQQNSFADYLWLGLAASLWLKLRPVTTFSPPVAGASPQRRPGTVLILLAATFLMTLSVMSGSRSIYLYAGFVTFWLVAWSFLSPNSGLRKHLRIAAVLVPLLLLLAHGIIPLLGESSQALQRVTADTSYAGIRTHLWLAALDIFQSHPLLGAGFDSYSREFFTRVDRFPIGGVGIPEHSHNIFTEFAAELGIVGLGLLLIALYLWLAGWWGRRRDQESADWLAIALLGVLGIHSQLEYPLWYAHFLGIAAIAASVGDTSGISLGNAPRHRLALSFFSLLGFYALFGFGHDYLRLERAARGVDENWRPITAQAQYETLADLYTRSIWSSLAALQFASRIPIGDGEITAQLAMAEDASHLSPIRKVVFRQAALLQLAGKTEAAARQLQLAALAYPGEIGNAREMLRLAAEKHPELQALLTQLDQHNQQNQRNF